jgi:hypothetical protein
MLRFLSPDRDAPLQFSSWYTKEYMDKYTHQYTIFGERVGKPRSKANDCRATLAGIESEAIELEAFWRLL